MTETILTASGIPFRQGRYINPPPETYAVYFDHLTKDGPDPVGIPAPHIVTHDVMVELYEPIPAPDAEERLEAQLNARGLQWTKQDRYWLQNVQRYQVIYEFNYNEKRRT